MKKIIAIMAVLAIVLTGCGKKEESRPVQERGEIEKENLKTEIDVKAETKKQQTVDEILNPKITLEKGEAHEKDALPSYYKRTALNENESLRYDEIYQSIEDHQEKITLSERVTPEQLKKIMTIIFLDTPELFHIEHKYAYKTNLDGKVELVKVFYTINKEQYLVLKDRLIQGYADEIRNIRSKNSYEAIQLAIGSVNKQYTKNNAVGSGNGLNFNKDLNTVNTILSTEFGNGTGTFGAASKVNYLLRKGGVDSAIKVGVLNIDNPLTRYGYDLENYKDFDEENIYKEYKVDQLNYVELDLTGLHAFNTVKIGDEWYNIDVLTDKIMTQDFRGIVSTDVKPLLSITTDYMMAQTRSFYINEKLLGLTPSCDTYLYMDNYRSKKLLPTIPKSVMPAVQAKIAIDFVKNGKTFYQFSDHETYELFVKNFNNAMNQYNKKNNNAVETYRVHTDPYTLSFFAYDIVKY